MTWQPHENSPAHLDPRDVEGAPPAGSGSGEFVETAETSGTADSQRHEGLDAQDAGPEAEQSRPIEDGALDATDEQKITGILDQTRQDLEQGHARSALELLAQRFEQSGIPVSEWRLAELAASLQQYEER
ncbi:hypothetical protein [Yonghaparkia sp. Soil809]|uniref:hypothetical protein n=1 Tax=Yonghaparkia sp. Soil809 TaxID=1736417 RepID=UPI0006F89B9F|nr:hypothetical protein [Yonghaparkia sp. Soil809]KRF31092.1 hypothetical protein ASG83_09735 [Yonghaparkia sp. Soil809]